MLGAACGKKGEASPGDTVYKGEIGIGPGLSAGIGSHTMFDPVPLHGVNPVEAVANMCMGETCSDKPHVPSDRGILANLEPVPG